MVSSESSNWDDFDCSLFGGLPVDGDDLVASLTNEISWNLQGVGSSSNASLGNNGSIVVSGALEESNSQKRVSAQSYNGPGSKACREKKRRDNLNDRFLELRTILEPEKSQKMDKVSILSDASRTVTQLRSETQKLKESNESLQEKIKELEVEKSELRDEKHRLRVEKENLELQIKMLSARPSFTPHPPVIPTTFGAHSQAVGAKAMMPFFGYPGFPMWQLMPAADVNTSQDAESCSPVA